MIWINKIDQTNTISKLFKKMFFFFRYVHGCLQSCNDADACNDSPLPSDSMSEVLFIGLITQFAIYNYVF